MQGNVHRPETYVLSTEPTGVHHVLIAFAAPIPSLIIVRIVTD